MVSKSKRYINLTEEQKPYYHYFSFNDAVANIFKWCKIKIYSNNIYIYISSIYKHYGLLEQVS